MGTVKVTNIEPIADNGTVTLGGSGDNLVIGSGAVPKFNYPAFEAFLASDQTVSDNVATKLQAANEVFDTDNMYDSSTNYRFTPTVAGKYYVYGAIQAHVAGGTSNIVHINLLIYKNGNEYKLNHHDFRNNYAFWFTGYVEGVVEMNGTTDYLELYGAYDSVSTGTLLFKGHSDRKYSYFGAYRIGG